MELHGLPGGRSEHELQLHRAGKKHWANAAAVEARIKAIGAVKAAKPKKRRSRSAGIISRLKNTVG
jgi:hypothetical protein